MNGKPVSVSPIFAQQPTPAPTRWSHLRNLSARLFSGRKFQRHPGATGSIKRSWRDDSVVDADSSDQTGKEERNDWQPLRSPRLLRNQSRLSVEG